MFLLMAMGLLLAEHLTTIWEQVTSLEVIMQILTQLMDTVFMLLVVQIGMAIIQKLIRCMKVA